MRLKNPSMHIALNITNRCNQKCIFCFEGDRIGWIEQKVDNIKSLLVKASEKCNFVIFMGAEALLREDIFEIIKITHSLGLLSSVFTNGQILARDGFIEELADKGLRFLDISFHYASEEKFAKGSGVSPKNFEKILNGLTNLRNHNRKNPEKAILPTLETDLFIYNYGDLRKIRDLAEKILAESYVKHRIGTISPIDNKRKNINLLEPLFNRREELINFLESWDKKSYISFTKIPLCLIPNWEYLSIDVIYKLGINDVMSNFDDKQMLKQMHNFKMEYVKNPFRWECCVCAFLPICRTERCQWFSNSNRPAENQKPIPVKNRKIQDVIIKILKGKGNLFLDSRRLYNVLKNLNKLNKPWFLNKEIMKQVITNPFLVVEELNINLKDIVPKVTKKMISFWRKINIPERKLIDSLYSLQNNEFKIKNVFCTNTPIFNLSLIYKKVNFILMFKGIDSNDKPLQFIINYLEIVVIEPKKPEKKLIFDLLKKIAKSYYPPLKMWENYEYICHPTAYAAKNIWDIFGSKIWPGQIFNKNWVTSNISFMNDICKICIKSKKGDIKQIFIHI